MIIEKYKAWLSSNGASENTVNSYIESIGKVLKSIKLEELNEENIINYILELSKTHKTTTVNKYKSTLRSFVIFLNKDIRIPKDKTIESRLPEYITEKYFEKKIIPVVESIFTKPLKVKAILYFMFYSGLRFEEVLNLKRKDINLKEGIIKVYRKKNKKERLTMITNTKAKAIIKMYFSTDTEKDNAFNETKHSLKYKFRTLKLYFKDIKFKPHLLRHSFATHLITKGANITDIKYLLGHSNIQTTMIYAHVEIEGLKKRINKLIK